jgi:hypothetical protein
MRQRLKVVNLKRNPFSPRLVRKLKLREEGRCRMGALRRSPIGHAMCSTHGSSQVLIPGVAATTKSVVAKVRKAMRDGL